MKRLLAGTLLAAALVVPSVPATAACPAPAGTVGAFPSPTRDPATVSFTGRGWGHGIGMSQHGARGAALLGCSWQEILAGYYPGTTPATRTDPGTVRVGLMLDRGDPDVTSTTLKNIGTDDVEWYYGSTKVHTQKAGTSVVVRASSTNRLSIWLPGAPAPAWKQSAGGGGTIAARLSATKVLEVTRTGRPYARGALDVISGADGQPDATVRQVVRLPNMDTYLYGLGEMPWAWPAQALRSQAVAARTFAHATLPSSLRPECSCDLYDSVQHQAYIGARWERAYPTYLPKWVEAVDSTHDRVLTHDGALIATFYSSTNGGVSQTPREAWGSGATDLPYLPAQNTATWENAAASAEWPHEWVDDLAAGTVADMFGIEVLTGAAVSARTAQGRAATFRATGYAADGTVRSGSISGDTTLRSRLGLSSNFFDVDYTPPRARRIAGADRYETAAATSRAGWAGGATTVVVARGDDPSDALGGMVMAGDRDAPLLLTARGRLPAATEAEVRRLGASRAVVLGGTGAIGDAVVSRLQALGLSVTRVPGADRYATMANIARSVGVGSSRTAFVVQGTGWADALAVSGVAAARATDGNPSPVLGVGTSGIPAATRDAITALGITNVVVVGGTGVVSAAQVDSLRGMGLSVSRWAGANRYLTSKAVAGAAPGSGSELVVVTGTDFPDGLAAGAYAGRVDATLVLAPNSFDTSRTPWRATELPALFRQLADRHDMTAAVGGSAVLWPRTVRAAAWYLTPGAGTTGAATVRATGPEAPTERSELTDLLDARDLAPTVPGS